MDLTDEDLISEIAWWIIVLVCVAVFVVLGLSCVALRIFCCHAGEGDVESGPELLVVDS